MTRPPGPLLWTLIAANLAAVGLCLFSEGCFRSHGRPDLGIPAGAWILLVAWASALAVGAVLARQLPGHPVGWLFVALSSSFVLAFLVGVYADWAVRFRPGSLPGGEVAAVVSDSSWIPWLALLAWILFLTPSGQHHSPRWRLVARITAAAAVLTFVLAMLTHRQLAAPYEHVENPLVLEPVADVGVWLSWLAAIALGAGLVLSAVSVIVRFRRARADERRRLLWMAFALVPLPVLVVATYVASFLDNEVIELVASALFLCLVPIAAGLSVLRFRLYDVERIVATTLSWSLLTLLLVTVYAGVVWAGARLSAAWSPTPAATATVGAVAAALLAAPLRGWLQGRLDRRFNRRAYDAEQVVRSGLADDTAGLDAEALLRRALDDPTLSVAYPEQDGGWIGGQGKPATVSGRILDVTRGDRLVGRIAFDPDRVDESTVARVSRLLAAELDNTRMRADLEASRHRISLAQREERRRIERDLHDGAQQSLLALAFELQAAHLQGDPESMRAALSTGATRAKDAVRDLRDLANGLHPAALDDGGLPAVLDELARRSPVPLYISATVGRLDAATEFTAWLVVAEAVVNAQKHADATRIDVSVLNGDGSLRLEVRDNGSGGARGDGSGIRGLRDRIRAAHGTFRISSGADGTTVEAVIPCGS